MSSAVASLPPHSRRASEDFFLSSAPEEDDVLPSPSTHTSAPALNFDVQLARLQTSNKALRKRRTATKVFSNEDLSSESGPVATTKSENDKVESEVAPKSATARYGGVAVLPPLDLAAASKLKKTKPETTQKIALRPKSFNNMSNESISTLVADSGANSGSPSTFSLSDKSASEYDNIREDTISDIIRTAEAVSGPAVGTAQGASEYMEESMYDNMVYAATSGIKLETKAKPPPSPTKPSALEDVRKRLEAPQEVVRPENSAPDPTPSFRKTSQPSVPVKQSNAEPPSWLALASKTRQSVLWDESGEAPNHRKTSSSDSPPAQRKHKSPETVRRSLVKQEIVLQNEQQTTAQTTPALVSSTTIISDAVPKSNTVFKSTPSSNPPVVTSAPAKATQPTPAKAAQPDPSQDLETANLLAFQAMATRKLSDTSAAKIAQRSAQRTAEQQKPAAKEEIILSPPRFGPSSVTTGSATTRHIPKQTAPATRRDESTAAPTTSQPEWFSLAQAKTLRVQKSVEEGDPLPTGPGSRKAATEPRQTAMNVELARPDAAENTFKVTLKSTADKPAISTSASVKPSPVARSTENTNTGGAPWAVRLKKSGASFLERDVEEAQEREEELRRHKVPVT